MPLSLSLLLLQIGAGAASALELEAWVPYIIVILIGAVVGLAEIISTFSTTPILALGTRWGWILVLLNGGSAALVLWLVNRFVPTTADPLLVALAVGLGFPTLIRTNFTVAKRLEAVEGKDLSVNLGWIYDQFQNLARTQIDLALVSKRQKLHRDLLKKYPEIKDLVEMAQYLIQERALFSSADVERMQKYVESVRDSQTLSDQVKRVTLARFILDTGGPGYVRELVRGVGPRALRGS
jgi:hypothetical protein